MLRAIIFDCDGVIADTEPIHFASLQKTLDQEGIEITIEDYFSRYLALDDRGCFRLAHADHGRELSDERLAELIRRKAASVEPVMRERLELFDGVADFIRRADERFPLAIASGALRHEIELVLKHGGLTRHFDLIVSAEDVTHGKPHPEPFLKALDLINSARRLTVEPPECLVIEDSIHGVEAAHKAGMRCLAVTNSYTNDQLSAADMVTGSLGGVSIDQLESLF
jgi:HAD superfamily hydrolase (TIGR01509 family)